MDNTTGEVKKEVSSGFGWGWLLILVAAAGLIYLAYGWFVSKDDTAAKMEKVREAKATKKYLNLDVAEQNVSEN